MKKLTLGTVVQVVAPADVVKAHVTSAIVRPGLVEQLGRKPTAMESAMDAFSTAFNKDTKVYTCRNGRKGVGVPWMFSKAAGDRYRGLSEEQLAQELGAYAMARGKANPFAAVAAPTQEQVDNAALYARKGESLPPKQPQAPVVAATPVQAPAATAAPALDPAMAAAIAQAVAQAMAAFMAK